MWIIGVAALFLAMGLFLLKLRDDVRSLKTELDRYRNKYHHRSGWSSSYGSYSLFTNDGGKHWYATEDGVILGPVDAGLLEHLEAWDAMVRYVEERGPITLSKPGEKELLEKAGFSVEPVN